MGNCPCANDREPGDIKIAPCVYYNAMSENVATLETHQNKNKLQLKRRETSYTKSTEHKNKNPKDCINKKRDKLLSNFIENNSEDSDILFETFSISSSKNNSSIIVDYYQLSRNCFNMLNKYRMSNTKNQKRKIDYIMWNEKLYLCISSYLMMLDNLKKKKIDEKEIRKNANQRVSERLDGSYICDELFLEGDLTPKLFIPEMSKKDKTFSQIISNNYCSGAICCFPSKDSEMITLGYFVNKI